MEDFALHASNLMTFDILCTFVGRSKKVTETLSQERETCLSLDKRLKCPQSKTKWSPSSSFFTGAMIVSTLIFPETAAF